MDDFGMDVGLGAVKGAHYYRNELNTGLPVEAPAGKDGWVQLDSKESKYHRLRGESKNLKFVHESGKEAVYNSGNLVTSSLNKGTFNYVNPGSVKSITGVMKHAGHFIADVVPYYGFGNTPYDGSWITERTLGYSFGH
jgi:hypothetical protein